MNNNYKLLIALSITVGLIGCSAEEEADPTSNFSIEQIAGDLYKASTTTHRTVFLVTDDGVILSDPINRDFSTWLRGEIEQRFGVPVRYVLYTHHHWDHASGGAVFEDTATFIGHENMPERLELPPAGTPFPADAEGLDVDGDERISTEEAEGTYAATFDLYDYDGDGFLSGAEATRGRLNDVRPPDLTYGDELSVTLGGKTAKMVYTGVHTHTDDMTVVVFPEESVGFMADFISIVRPPRFIQGDQPIDTWIRAVRIVEAQGFDIAVGGHGAHAGSEYVTLFREYLEKLRDQVAAGIAAGDSLEQLQANIYMEEYADWISYDEFRESNIADMYNLLSREF
jgi:glyoxylase-like metal-dependent hydrolase (beta-lactamase superfamily II)